MDPIVATYAITVTLRSSEEDPEAPKISEIVAAIESAVESEFGFVANATATRTDD